MKILIVIYLVIPMYILILGLLASDETLPANDGDPPGKLEQWFLKIAVYIYRRFLSKNRLFLRSPGRRRVRENLLKLDSEGDMDAKLSLYYIKKLSNMFMVIVMGAILAILSWYSAGRSSVVGETGEIIRNDYGQGEVTARFEVTDEKGQTIGDFPLTVSEMEYTKNEIDRLYKEMIKQLPGEILNGNTDLEHVETDLKLPSSIEGYPFNIIWQTDDIDVLQSDGKVENRDISFESARVMLTAQVKYREYEWEHIFDVNVVPRQFSENERLQQEITGSLGKAEEDTRTQKSFQLPSDVEGTTLFWKEKIDENSIMVLLLALAAAASIFALGDKDLDKKVEERRKQMILEYPAFVSRLVLYMGSGMSVRAILMKFSADYKKNVSEGGRRSFLYDEINKCCHELESGVPEISVYERLGIRCGSQQYTRLVTLLSQNLKKGNSEMLTLLKEESDKATMERMSYARKLGEEAGTKLLVPMVMMLLIVMVVIIIPAYLSF